MAFIADISTVLLSAACVWLVLRGLFRTLPKSGFTVDKQRRIRTFVLLGIGGWLLATGILAFSGFLSDFSTFPPRGIIVLFIPLITILILTFSKSIRQLLAHVPAQWLIYPQVFRVLVEIILWMQYEVGNIPVQMTFEGRNLDILTGLTAPLVAYMVFDRKAWSPTVAVIWNILGLALLINIVGTALLSMPTPMRQFMNEPANTLVMTFPYVWIPAIFVTLAYTLHFFSLRQLLGKRSAEISQRA